MLGDPEEIKNVEEYVVFENHISSTESVWRMHGKVYPEWLAKKSQKVEPPRFFDDPERQKQLAEVEPPKKVAFGVFTGNKEKEEEKNKRAYEEGDMSPERLAAYEKKQRKWLGGGWKPSEKDVFKGRKAYKVDKKDVEEADRLIEKNIESMDKMKKTKGK